MLTNLTRLHISYGFLLSWTLYCYFQLRKEYLEAIAVLELESARSDYLLELFNKYDIPVDEFEKLALKFHHISVLPAAEEE